MAADKKAKRPYWQPERETARKREYSRCKTEVFHERGEKVRPADNIAKGTDQAYRGERVCREKGMKRLSISDLSTTGTYFREAVAPADNMSAVARHSAKIHL